MPSNTKEYAHNYYIAHKAHLKRVRKVYYYKNRERIIAHQVEYNRKAYAAKRAARAGLKPVRASVHRVSEVQPDYPRDPATERRESEPGTG